MVRLRELREARKVTQSQLGEYIGAKKSAISLWESGKRQPDQDTLVRLASYFGVSVDYLLGREEQQTPAQEEAPVITRDDLILERAREMNKEQLQDLLSKIIEIAMEKGKE